jgi:hypothetical protein
VAEAEAVEDGWVVEVGSIETGSVKVEVPVEVPVTAVEVSVEAVDFICCSVKSLEALRIVAGVTLHSASSAFKATEGGDVTSFFPPVSAFLPVLLPLGCGCGLAAVDIR